MAKDLARKCGLAHRTHFSVQIAEDIDYPSGFFDLVVGFDILHHVHIEPAIRECLRVLKERGAAIFREPIASPIFERIRNSRLGVRLVPRGKSFERHVTEDERKLTPDNVLTIRKIFPIVLIRRFTLLSRLDQFLRGEDAKGPSFLEKVDRFLLSTFPALERFAGSAVLILRKRPADSRLVGRNGGLRAGTPGRN